MRGIASSFSALASLAVLVGPAQARDAECFPSVRVRSPIHPRFDGIYDDTGRSQAGFAVYERVWPDDLEKQERLQLIYTKCLSFKAWILGTSGDPPCQMKAYLSNKTLQIYTDELPVQDRSHRSRVQVRGWFRSPDEELTVHSQVVAVPMMIAVIMSNRRSSGACKAPRISFPGQIATPRPLTDLKRLWLEDLGDRNDIYLSAMDETTSCWTVGFHPTICCVPPVGSFGASFDNRFPAERCCKEVHYGSNGTVPLVGSRVPHSISKPLPETEDFTVDVLVRSYSMERVLMEMLLESMLLFWPWQRWRSKLIFVMDIESEEDHIWCDKLAAIYNEIDSTRGTVKCFYEAKPAWIRPVMEELGNPCRAMWSLHYGDHYSDADYIAVTDSDTVFHTFGIAQLLFDRTSKRPKPIIHGNWKLLYIMNPLVLGLPWSAEFMLSFPFVIHRKHFKDLREYMMSDTSQATFDDAWKVWIARLKMHSRLRLWWTGYAFETPSFHALIGQYLYVHHQSEYFWSIRNGLGLQLPPHHSCPSFHVATHMTEGLLPDVDEESRLKTGQLYKWREDRPYIFTHAYQAMAYKVMSLGLLNRNLRDTWQWQQKKDVVAVLLSPNAATKWFKGAKLEVWTPEEAEHCHRRDTDQLLAAYFNLDVEAERSEAYRDHYQRTLRQQGKMVRKTKKRSKNDPKCLRNI